MKDISELTPLNEVGSDGFDSVNPLAGLVTLGGVQPAQGEVNDLALLRMAFPFLPILPVPFEVVSVVTDAGVTATDLLVPDGAVLGRFLGNGDYYVSMTGNAVIPSAAEQAASIAQGNQPNKSMYKPEYTWFYLGGHRSFSVKAPGITIVQLHCFSPRGWPQFK